MLNESIELIWRTCCRDQEIVSGLNRGIREGVLDLGCSKGTTAELKSGGNPGTRYLTPTRKCTG